MLKKVSIFFSLLLVSPCFGEVVRVSETFHDDKYSRRVETFYYNYNDTELFCTFFQNKYLIVVLQSLSDDMMLELPISVGTYVKSNNFLLLTDAFTGIVMNARQENKKLSFSTGFEVMIENDLIQGEAYYGSLFDDYFEKRPETLVGIVSPPTRTNLAGFYSEGGNTITSLNLLANKHFELHFYDLPLLSGTWEQSGGDVLLLSRTVNKPLKLSITKDGLYGSCMFGYLYRSSLTQHKSYGTVAPAHEESETLCEKKIVIFSIIAVICLCIIFLRVHFW